MSVRAPATVTSVGVSSGLVGRKWQLFAVLPLSLAFGLGAENHAGVLFLVLFAGLFGLLLATNVELAFLACCASRPIVDSFVHLRLGPLSAGQAWGAGFVLVAAGVVLRSPSVSGLIRAYQTPLLFLTLYFVCTFGRNGTERSLLYEMKMASWVLAAMATEYVARNAFGQRRVLGAGLVSAWLLALVVAIAIHLNHYGAAYYAASPRSVDDPVQGPHGLASFAVLLLPFALLPILGRISRGLAWILLGIVAAEVILSFVRSAVLAMAMVIGGYAILGIMRRRGAVISAIAVACGAGLIAYSAYEEAISSRLARGAPRLAYWEPVVRGTLNDPIAFFFGRGADSSFHLIHEALGLSIWSHNDFVDFFATGGIVLLIAYGFLIRWMAISMFTLFRSPQQSRAARDIGLVGLTACAAFVVLSVFNGIAFSPASIAIGLMIGLVRGMSATATATWVDQREESRPHAVDHWRSLAWTTK